MSTTRLQPGLSVVDVGEAAGAVPPGCGEVYVLAERLTDSELDDVLRTLTLVAPATS